MYCGKCGKQLPDGAKFCNECGYKLPERKKPTPLAQPEATIPVVQPETYTPEVTIPVTPIPEPTPEPVYEQEAPRYDRTPEQEYAYTPEQEYGYTPEQEYGYEQQPAKHKKQKQQKPKKKGKAGVVIAIILILALAAGAAWFFLFGGRDMIGGLFGGGGKKKQIEIDEEILDEIIAMEGLDEFADPIEIYYAKVTDKDEYDLLGVECRDEYITVKGENEYVTFEAGYLAAYYNEDGEWVLDDVRRNEEYCEYGHGFTAARENISEDEVEQLVAEELGNSALRFDEISIEKHDEEERMTAVSLTVTGEIDGEYVTADAEATFGVTPEGWYLRSCEITDKREAQEPQTSEKPESDSPIPIETERNETMPPETEINIDVTEPPISYEDVLDSMLEDNVDINHVEMDSSQYLGNGIYEYTVIATIATKYTPFTVELEISPTYRYNESTDEWEYNTQGRAVKRITNPEHMLGKWEYTKNEKTYWVDIKQIVNNESEYESDATVTLEYNINGQSGSETVNAYYSYAGTEVIGLVIAGEVDGNGIMFKAFPNSKLNGWYVGDNIHLTKDGAPSTSDGYVIEGELKDSVGLAYQSRSGGVKITGIGACTDTDIVIPAYIDGKPVVEIAEHSFYNGNITSVFIPDTVKEIGNFAFYGCSQLWSLVIDDSKASIGEGAFMHCNSLVSVYLGDSITSIGNHAFGACNIAEITIPDTVTSIGLAAFSNNALKTITIPDSVTTFGRQAFCWCTDLTDIYCEATSKPAGWNDLWNEYCNATVHWGASVSETQQTISLEGVWGYLQLYNNESNEIAYDYIVFETNSEFTLYSADYHHPYYDSCHWDKEGWHQEAKGIGKSYGEYTFAENKFTLGYVEYGETEVSYIREFTVEKYTANDVLSIKDSEGKVYTYYYLGDEEVEDINIVAARQGIDISIPSTPAETEPVQTTPPETEAPETEAPVVSDPKATLRVPAGYEVAVFTHDVATGKTIIIAKNTSDKLYYILDTNGNRLISTGYDSYSNIASPYFGLKGKIYKYNFSKNVMEDVVREVYERLMAETTADIYYNKEMDLLITENADWDDEWDKYTLLDSRYNEQYYEMQLSLFDTYPRAGSYEQRQALKNAGNPYNMVGHTPIVVKKCSFSVSQMRLTDSLQVQMVINNFSTTGKYGVFGANIPFEYEELYAYAPKWDPLWYVANVGSDWGVLDGNNAQVIKLKYGDIMVFANPEGSSYKLYAVVSKMVNGKKTWGVVDQYGNTVVPFEYEKIVPINFTTDLTKVGYLGMAGTDYNNENLEFYVKKNGSWSAISAK